MTEPSSPPRLTRLTFHGPLSEQRAARIVDRLARAEPRSVLDIGCGWGELMLRLLEAAPESRGIGIDIKEEDLARGRARAQERGLSERVEFVAESAVGTGRGPADVVLCLSSSHALSDANPPEHTAAALKELRALVNPGGRVVLAEAFWQRPPTDAELAPMWPDASAAEFHDLATLTDLAVAAGFRLSWLETASDEEWEEFESGYQSDVEEWLAANSGHPLAEETRARLDGHRSSWLRGYRGVMGIAYLTLVPVA